MSKQAYLVMAHNNWGVLKKQIELLDDERNDFYIHIDKRATDFDPAEVTDNVRYSKVHFIDRRCVFWADYSQTQVELDLISAAVEGGEYSYLHLMSGSDLPIKSKDEIYSYFNATDKIYLCLMTENGSYQNNRTKYYFPLINTKWYRKYKIVKAMSLLLGKMQFFLGINRHKKKENYEVCYCGWNWFSIPIDFAKYVLDNQERVYSTFHHTLASDEAFLQTIAMNSDYIKRVYKTDCHEESVMRFNTYKLKDFDEIMGTPYFFVRKVEENVDADIAEKIYRTVSEMNRS